MSSERSHKEPKKIDFRKQISIKEQRMIRARRLRPVGTWSAFHSMGAVGWLVSLPTVLGCFLGVWMDYSWPGPVSWTLTMLGVGLFIGCVLAGLWMTREKNRIIREREEWKKRTGNITESRTMAETDLMISAAAFGTGMLLGAFHFGTLWLTVRMLPGCVRPRLFFWASLLGRYAVTLACFAQVIKFGGMAAACAILGFHLLRSFCLSGYCRCGPPLLSGFRRYLWK